MHSNEASYGFDWFVVPFIHLSDNHHLLINYISGQCQMNVKEGLISIKSVD